MPWGIVIGAGVGLLNSQQQQQQINTQNEMNAIKERYSPWTGQHGTITPAANPFASMLQYGTAGAQTSRAIKHPSGSIAPLGSVSGGPQDTMFNNGFSPFDQSYTLES